jgi:predicted nucleic acid-binding protein
MIADTNFLIHYFREGRDGRRGPARTFLANHRAAPVRTCVIAVAEVAVSFPLSTEAWDYFSLFKIYALHRGIAEAAADVDRELIRTGERLGENDNWIAGFCRYYREPLISQDRDFDRVQGLRRVAY